MRVFSQIARLGRFFFPLLFGLVLFYLLFFALAGAAKKLGPSGLALPRFVSIKASKANVRSGPGFDYPVIWHYQKKDLPVEIVQEYDNWRKIKDSEGDEGWIYHSLLSGRRMVLVAPWQKSMSDMIIMHKKPYENSPFLSLVEAGALGRLVGCDGVWCSVLFTQGHGFIKQDQLWGVYEGEVIE